MKLEKALERSVEDAEVEVQEEEVNSHGLRIPAARLESDTAVSKCALCYIGVWRGKSVELKFAWTLL